jgi:uncharacterized FlgJ-related protein
MGTKTKSALQIVVIERGWVLVGRVTEHPDTLVITNANVVRVWGTSKGLGELAAKGPRSSTVLDPCGIVTVEKHAALFRIDCAEQSWAH